MVCPRSERKVPRGDIIEYTNLAEIFFVLSDNDSLEIIRMMAEQVEVSKARFGSPKRYYSRLSKLKKVMIIKRKGKSYELTAFGTILHELIKGIRVARGVHWRLQAIDSLDYKVPIAERAAIIELLIPDKRVRAILLARYHGESQMKKDNIVTDYMNELPVVFDTVGC